MLNINVKGSTTAKLEIAMWNPDKSCATSIRLAPTLDDTNQLHAHDRFYVSWYDVASGGDLSQAGNTSSAPVSQFTPVAVRLQSESVTGIHLEVERSSSID